MRRIPAIVLALLMLRCGDGRPGSAEAKAFFEQCYPYAELIEVKESEGEVVPRSFTFRYRKAGQTQVADIEIQFMEDPATGRWSPQPEEPRSLP